MERINRINHELKSLFKEKLDDNKIFYELNENDNDIIKVLMIGIEDTPYENGFFLFTLRFPEFYPNEPVKMWYYTTHSNIRFNPNLYNNGKLCLSIINTWGNTDNWNSQMNAKSVLLSIQSMVLINDSLNNEPHLNPSDEDIQLYNDILYYSVFNIAILDVLTFTNTERYLENDSKNKTINFINFKDIIMKYFTNNIDWYKNRCIDLHYKYFDHIFKYPRPFNTRGIKFSSNFCDVLLELIQINNLNSINKLSNTKINISYINFNKLTLIKLKQLCKKNNIKKYSKLRKNEIIELIKLKIDNDIFI